MALGKEMADWKERVLGEWPGVAVEHVDVSIPDAQPSLGAEVDVHAYVHLGGLSPQDVLVQIAYGRVDADDVITAPTVEVLTMQEGYDGGRWRFDGRMPLDRTGPFGYTVRVLPSHVGLASPADLGVLAVPR